MDAHDLWDEALHPRGRDGRFIFKTNMVRGLFHMEDGESWEGRGEVIGFRSRDDDASASPWVLIEAPDGRWGYTTADNVVNAPDLKAMVLNSPEEARKAGEKPGWVSPLKEGSSRWLDIPEARLVSPLAERDKTKAESRLLASGAAEDVNLYGVPPEYQDIIVDRLVALHGEYHVPVKGVYSNSVAVLKGMKDGNEQDYAAYQLYGDALTLGADWEKPGGMEKSVAQEKSAGWFPPYATPAGIINHEYGHVLTHSPRGAKTSDHYLSYSVSGELPSEKAHREVMDTLIKKHADLAGQDIVSVLGEYPYMALQRQGSAEELIAEAFNAYKTGITTSWIQEIGQTIDRDFGVK
jgi:hypothetical protein